MSRNFAPESSGVLRTAFVSGIALLLLFGAGLVVFHNTVGFESRGPASFHALLTDYDFRYRRLAETGAAFGHRQLADLSAALDHLESRAQGVENWLSLLKRRRHLAVRAEAIPGTALRYAEIYRQTALRAWDAFPLSEPLAAVAAAALVRDAAITADTEERLREILPILTSAAFVPMRLDLHVLLGDFNSPEIAAQNLLEDGRASPGFVVSTMGQEAEEVLVALAILRALEGETWEAFVAIQSALNSGWDSREFIRFAAEFFYDFGSLSASAQLFHSLPGNEALIRQADALWLAGYTGLARHLWAMLDDAPAELAYGFRNAGAIESMALYNLAATAETAEEERALLARLVAQSLPGDMYRELGLIRLSRFMEGRGAVAALETERGAAGYAQGFPISALIDLEILKRRVEMGEAGLIVSDVWMLLNQYPEEEGLRQWALWLFDAQRNFVESAVLLRAAERQGFSGAWMDAHEALGLIREGRFDAAIRAMEDLQAESPDWTISANLGRVFEARNASARALEHYQRALDLLMENGVPGRRRDEAASQLQFRIARCLRTLGRFDESRRALHMALELNPDNLNARLELSRM